MEMLQRRKKAWVLQCKRWCGCWDIKEENHPPEERVKCHISNYYRRGICRKFFF
jgi:hypothetical protein